MQDGSVRRAAEAFMSMEASGMLREKRSIGHISFDISHLSFSCAERIAPLKLVDDETARTKTASKPKFKSMTNEKCQMIYGK